MPPYLRYTLLLIFAVLAFRVSVLYFSPLGLHGDEAQYWAWSQDLNWGYFTKPPLIAWVIAITTSIFGHAEWAVRLASPLLHSVTAWVVFATARKLYDAHTGFWAACLYLLMPALWLSGGIISTDVPLLLFWAGALNAWVHLRDRLTWPRLLQFGICLGLGILAKYAMLFMLPAIILCMLVDGPTRRAFVSVKSRIAFLLALVIITPNIYWNITHDFATFEHTAANANLDATQLFHPDEVLSFWADQLVVFGPISLALFILAIMAVFRGKLTQTSMCLMIFALTPLVIISIEALLSRANANWAVTSYVAASILTAHYGSTQWTRLKRTLIGGILLQTLTCLGLIIVLLVPDWTDKAGLSNSVKRLRKWPETVATLETLYTQGNEGIPYQALAVDRRILFYDLKYYGMEKTAPLKILRFEPRLQNHAELITPLRETSGPILIIGMHDRTAERLSKRFARLEALPAIDIPLGGGKTRHLQVWAGYGYRSPEMGN